MNPEINSNNLIEALKPEAVVREIDAVVKGSGLAEDSAITLRGQFADYYSMIVEWRDKAAMVTRPDDSTHQQIAREVRLGLRRVRCEVENTRKQLKADSLARGKAIDGFANVLKYLCEPVEAKLLEVEQYAERQAAARLAAIVADRQALLVSLGADPTPYNLTAMDDETFKLVVDSEKKKREERLAAERAVERERIEREQADRIAREQAEAEASKARAAAEAERQARKEAEESLRQEREAREKAEREVAAARQAAADRIAREQAAVEAQAKAEREAAEKAAQAPDKAKAMAFASDVRRLRESLPEGQTAAGKALFNDIGSKCLLFAEWIEKQAKTL